VILLDTNVIIACANTADSCHENARRVISDVSSGVYGTSVITDYVFDEALTVCLQKSGHDAACKLGNALLESFIVLKVSESLFQHALALFTRVKMSFTDCANIAAAEQLSIEHIASFDQEYKKATNTNIVE